MARSEIITAFAKNQVELESVLRQLKLLLVDLGKEDLISWVNCEIEGYPIGADLPSYRKYEGVLKGTFLNRNTQCSNTPIPLRPDAPDEIKEQTTKATFREGVNALRVLQSSTGTLQFLIPGDCLFLIQSQAAVSMTYLMNAWIEVSDTAIPDVISAIENRVMDVLLLLEKEYGILDGLTLDLTPMKHSDIEDVAQRIQVIIYDNHIDMGDNNKIKNSLLAGQVSGVSGDISV